MLREENLVPCFVLLRLNLSACFRKMFSPSTSFEWKRSCITAFCGYRYSQMLVACILYIAIPRFGLLS